MSLFLPVHFTLYYTFTASSFFLPSYLSKVKTASLVLSYLHLSSSRKCLEVALRSSLASKHLHRVITSRTRFPSTLEKVRLLLLCINCVAVKPWSGYSGDTNCPAELQEVQRWPQRRHDPVIAQMFCTTHRTASIFRRLLSTSALLYRYTWFQFPPNSFRRPVYLHKLLQSKLESLCRHETWIWMQNIWSQRTRLLCG